MKDFSAGEEPDLPEGIAKLKIHKKEAVAIEEVKQEKEAKQPAIKSKSQAKRVEKQMKGKRQNKRLNNDDLAKENK